MKLKFKESVQREGDVKSFVFEAPEPLSWQAGQFIHYTFQHPDADDRGIERWFTVSSAPSEHDVVITTRINSERSSSFKTALLALKPGDTIEADAPEGDFVVDDPTQKSVFIAGGIGITPYRSILKEAAAQGQQLDVKLLYANRTDEVAFKDELDTLRQANPSLTIDYIIAPRKLDEDLLQQVVTENQDAVVYVSGPEPMVEDLTDKLAAMGLPKDQIKGDYFPNYEAE
jgi:ferredoxin-NADP reductase